LSVQFNEKKITIPASFAKDLLGYLGSARASRATFGVGGNGVVSKLRKFSRAGLVRWEVHIWFYETVVDVCHARSRQRWL